MSAELPKAVARLLGQHPAALRSVVWRDTPLAADELGHLEIETKHGQVVVIDHASGAVYAEPPVPEPAGGERQARDLTATVPAAFDGRPTITAIRPGRRAWSFALSSGVEISFSLHPTSPMLSTRRR